jgi:hypothetical protein
MESNEKRPPSPPGQWLKIAYLLWAIFAAVVCGRIAVQAFLHPEMHLRHTVYPVLAEGSIRWWNDLPLHGRIESLGDIYRYSPTFAILFTPFARLPEWLGACLWGLLSIGLFVAAMRVAARELLPGQWTEDRQGVFLGLTLLGAMSGIWSGQSNAALIALVIFALSAIRRNRWWTASWLLALPVFIKLWPLAVVLLLAACWPKQLSWRFAVMAIAFALLPFVTRPPSTVIGQYQEWFSSLTHEQQNRWPGYRDAWTIWETASNAFGGSPVSPNAYRALQLLSAVAVLGWCLWQKRRISKLGHLFTAILSIWVSWQLLFGPGTEQITYGILAPSAAWAVMVAFEEKKNRDLNSRPPLRIYFHRGWTLFAWLTLGLFGMGDIEKPILKILSAATTFLPLGVLMFLAWLIIHETGLPAVEVDE